MSESVKNEMTKEDIKKMSILAVAQSLGMEMIQDTRTQYHWAEHDSLKIDVRRNLFKWYPKDKGGDVINLVMMIKEVPYKDAIHYLKTGEFELKEIETTRKQEQFNYLLSAYETDFSNARNYLKTQRSLSDETIDFFLSKGVIASANRKYKDGYSEEVIVFKSMDYHDQVIGASLQGITPNTDRYPGKGYLKQIMYNSDGASGLNVRIGESINQLIFFESPIDLMSYYELHQDSLTNVQLIAMDGLKEQIISRYLAEYLLDKNQQPTDSISMQEKLNLLGYLQKNTDFFERKENQALIVLAVDNDDAGLKFINKFKERKIPMKIDLPKRPESDSKADWNDILRQSTVNDLVADNKKAPEINQERNDSDRVKILDSLQENPEGSITPESQSETFEQTVTSHPTSSYLKNNIGGEFHRTSDYLGAETPGTVSQPIEQNTQSNFPTNIQLHFTTNNVRASTRKPDYHVITERELNRLNLFAPTLQTTAQWYLKEVADKNFYYFYKNSNGELENIKITFQKKNFAHLAGISPLNRTMSEAVVDFANGNGAYDNISVSNALKDKIKVLPLLPEVIESGAFLFNDISDIEKINNLDMSHAIQPEDTDLLVLFKDTDLDNLVPASLMRIKGNLKIQLENIKSNIVLGVYRERDGKIEQLSVNTDYIKDNGYEMMTMLSNQDSIQPLREELVPLRDSYSPEADLSQEQIVENIQSAVSSETVLSVTQMIEQKDFKRLSNHLRAGILSYRDSDTFKNYLDTMSKFHQYSPLNIQMILSQKGHARMIASYKDWQEKFNRQVNKGEKGIKIRVPVQVIQKDENGKPLLNEDGEQIIHTYYKFGTVFDISQTSGQELPRPIYLLEDNVVDYENIYRSARAMIHDNNISMTFSDTKEANGYYSPAENKIVISNRGMSESQIMKTIFHEFAHAKLHQNSTAIFGSELYALQELEAESVAYVVSKHYGIETGNYTFGYLNNWLRDKKRIY